MPYLHSRPPVSQELPLGEFSPWFDLKLFALAGLLGISLAILPTALLLDGLRIWAHEFGHALCAWFFGHRAIPLPLGWTNVEEDRSLMVYGCVLSLLGYWAYYAWSQAKYWALVFPLALTLIQLVCTWFVQAQTYEFYLASGGIHGEFILSTLILVLYFVKLPAYFKWNWLRVPALIGASFVFFQSYWQWHLIRVGQAEIPWGTAWSGAEDSGGDMNTLQDAFAMSDTAIIQHYSSLSYVCLGIIAATIIVNILLKTKAPMRRST